MKFSKHIWYLFYLASLFSGCIKEFEPPSRDYENVLVVEAFLTDSEDPFEVKLSRSFPIDTSALIPENGASVSLTEETGETYNLVGDGFSGIYFYPGAINAQVGKSYQIHIKTRDGNQYESSAVTMRATPEIDSITFAFEERPAAGDVGVQIFMNTADPQNNTWYYRWVWDETWEFRTPYDSYLIWEDNQIKMREEDINTCWKFDRSTSIDISTSRNLVQDRISDFPLRFVSTNSDRLKIKYSINVKQFSLSEESYNYWKELQKVTENLGTLFDPQPSTVTGNIYNIANRDEVVLGYFDAATVQEQRIFIRSSDLPPTRYPDYFSYCEDSIVSYGLIPEMIEGNWWLVGETINEAGFPAYIMSYPSCIACTLYGTNEKPDYWD